LVGKYTMSSNGRVWKGLLDYINLEKYLSCDPDGPFMRLLLT